MPRPTQTIPLFSALVTDNRTLAADPSVSVATYYATTSLQPRSPSKGGRSNGAAWLCLRPFSRFFTAKPRRQLSLSFCRPQQSTSPTSSLPAISAARRGWWPPVAGQLKSGMSQDEAAQPTGRRWGKCHSSGKFNSAQLFRAVLNGASTKEHDSAVACIAVAVNVTKQKLLPESSPLFEKFSIGLKITHHR